MEIMWLTFWVMFIPLAVCVFIIVLSDRKIGYLQGLFKRPVVYLPRLENRTDLSTVLKILPKLSDSEIEIILTTIFGRSVTIVKGRDTDGATWVEYVSYFRTDGQEDFNFHYQQKKDKNMFG